MYRRQRIAPLTRFDNLLTVNKRGSVNALSSLMSAWQSKRDDDEVDNLSQKQKRSACQKSSNRPQKRRKTAGREHNSSKLFVIDAVTGAPRHGTPADSLWWINYVKFPQMMTKRMKTKFRRRFRLPFKTWQRLVAMMEENLIFKQWHSGKTDAVGNPSSPIELLSLGALRYLARKCTFDSLEELTFISERTHERFFHAFIEFGATELYSMYVLTPRTPDEAELHMNEMRQAGFDGAIGSMDATHVIIENCRFGLRQAHLGHKLNLTARTYNIIVNHRRRILSSTSGHPSRWNDKTIVKFDEVVNDIRDGRILQDNKFTLYETANDGTIVFVTYYGVWIVVDNGYLEWSHTVPPIVSPWTRSELRWSQWVESMRKDVECTFGIMKKRFLVLKYGVQGKSIQNADKVWKTCCSLHNLLLETDGRDNFWGDGIPSDNRASKNFAIRRLNGNRDLFLEGEFDASPSLKDADDSGIVRHVDKMSLESFRSKLIEHFDILFRHHKISWPVSCAVPQRPV